MRVDAWTLPIVRGDRFLLCSDGLVDEVHDDAISDVLTTISDAQRAADELVALANREGGRDNVTVVVVDVLDGAEPPDPETELDLEPAWQPGATASTWAVDDPEVQATEFEDLAELVAAPTGRGHDDAAVAAGRHRRRPPAVAAEPPTAAQAPARRVPRRARRARRADPRVRDHRGLGAPRVLRRLQRRRCSGDLPGPAGRIPVVRADRGGADRVHARSSSTTTRSTASSAEPEFSSRSNADEFVAEQLQTTTTTTSTTTTTTVPATTTTVPRRRPPGRSARLRMASASPIASSRRSTELSLVVMAALITAGGYTLASLGSYARIPARIVPFLAVLLAMLIVAHLAVRWFARGADATMLPLAALLHGIGYVMITRLDDRLAGLQATWSIVAVVVFVATLLVVQRAPDLARYRWSFLLAGIVLLLLPMVPGVGYSSGGARIWVNLGPINFQPGEFAKLALAIFFAGYLAETRELIATGTWKVGPLRLPEPRHLLPILLAWAFAVLVMVGQRDLGSSLLFFALFVVMMWVATERAAFLVIGLVLFGSAAYIAWRLFGHVQTRVDIWLDPWSRSLDEGYQIVQALYGLTDGGIAGTGLGRGSPNQVPEAQNDFIFTAIGEELGLFGAAAVLMAYLLLIGAGLRTALRTDNTFEKLLAVGLTTIIGVQAFIIVAGVIKVVPLTGITLPFVSYGGSSLVSNYILLALLIRLSDSGARRLHELPDDPTPAERWAARRLRRRTLADALGEPAGVSREPPDPPARRRPDGVLRAAVRRPQLLAGGAAGGPQRPLRQHPGDPPRVRAARAGRSRPSTAWSPPGRCRTRPAASSRISASTRRVSSTPTSPATTRSPSDRPGSSARRTRCSPAAPASSACATSPASSPEPTTPARCG